MGAELSQLPREIKEESEDRGGLLRVFLDEYEATRGDPLLVYNRMAAKLRELEAKRKAEVREEATTRELAAKDRGFVQVLVVDSNEEALETARQVFVGGFGPRSEAVKFETARSAAEALERIASANGDGAKLNVVLHELRFGGQDASEFLDALATTALASNTSVSVLTDATEGYEACLTRGANDVVVKPLTVGKLAQAVLDNGFDTVGPAVNDDEAGADVLRDDTAAVLDKAFDAPLEPLFASSSCTIAAENGLTRDETDALQKLKFLSFGADFAGKKVLVGFVTSLSQAPASRNLVRLLKTYAPALERAGVSLLLVGSNAVSEDDVAAALGVPKDKAKLAAVVRDVSLEFSAALVGLQSDGDGAAAPRTGLVLIDEKSRVLDRRVACIEAIDTALDHDFADALACTASPVAGPDAGVLSAAHFLHQVGDAAWGLDLLAVRPLPELRDEALATASLTLKVKEVPKPGGPPLDPRNVLLVEDSAMSASMLARKLLRLGHAVLYAADGLDALKLLKKFPTFLDLVISDVMMPRMDGVALLTKINHALPVCLLTGLDADQDQMNVLCDELGAVAVLKKPLKLELLRTVVHDATTDDDDDDDDDDLPHPRDPSVTGGPSSSADAAAPGAAVSSGPSAGLAPSPADVSSSGGGA